MKKTFLWLTLFAIVAFGQNGGYPGINQLTDLDNVNVADADSGEVLSFDGANWVSDTISGGSGVFADSARVASFADSARVAGGGGETRWTPFTAEFVDGNRIYSTILTTLNTNFLPVRHRFDSDSIWYYGVIDGGVEGDTLNVHGPPLLTANAVEFQYGSPDVIRYKDFVFKGTFNIGGATTTLLSTYLGYSFGFFQSWGQQAYLVHVVGSVGSTDTGGQPRVNVVINNNPVITAHANAGLELDPIIATVTDINPSNYTSDYATSIEVTLDANGGNNDATDLNLRTVWILQGDIND